MSVISHLHILHGQTRKTRRPWNCDISHKANVCGTHFCGTRKAITQKSCWSGESRNLLTSNDTMGRIAKPNFDFLFPACDPVGWQIVHLPIFSRMLKASTSTHVISSKLWERGHISSSVFRKKSHIPRHTHRCSLYYLLCAANLFGKRFFQKFLTI